MTERNILPYDGQAILIDDHGAGFDWPDITRTLIDTIPWQVETARIFGREMPIPRMTAWFGDGAYSYSGILHLPAPFPAVIERLRARAEALSGPHHLVGRQLRGPLWIHRARFWAIQDKREARVLNRGQPSDRRLSGGWRAKSAKCDSLV